MSRYYKINSEQVWLEDGKEDVEATLIEVGFIGKRPDSAKVIESADQEWEALVKALGDNLGGRMALINGTCSVPVAVMLGAELSDCFEIVGVYIPELSVYIIVFSCDPLWARKEQILAGKDGAPVCRK